MTLICIVRKLLYLTVVKRCKYQADLSVNMSILKWIACNIAPPFSGNIGIARTKPNQDTGTKFVTLPRWLRTVRYIYTNEFDRESTCVDLLKVMKVSFFTVTA